MEMFKESGDVSVDLHFFSFTFVSLDNHLAFRAIIDK